MWRMSRILSTDNAIYASSHSRVKHRCRCPVSKRPSKTRHVASVSNTASLRAIQKLYSA